LRVAELPRAHADQKWRGVRTLQRKWGGQCGEAIYAVFVERVHAVHDGAIKVHAVLLG
jgi:hypothetical protein